MQAFELLADQFGWRIVNITKNACPLELSEKRPEPCRKWNEKVISFLEVLKPDAVFTTSTRADLKSPTNADSDLALADGRKEVVPAGYLKQWARLNAAGVSVIALRDNPRMNINVPDCLELHFPDIMKCARRRRELLDVTDPARELEPKPPGVVFIDLTDYFCDEIYCYPIIDNIIVYRDKHHVSNAYARRLAPALGERIRAVRSDLFPGNVETAPRVIDPEAG
jgi:hypothetical protein